MSEMIAEGFSLVRGNPSAEELAAAVLMLAAELADPPPAAENRDRPIAGGWNSYWRKVRQPFVFGPEAWRGSLR